MHKNDNSFAPWQNFLTHSNNVTTDANIVISRLHIGTGKPNLSQINALLHKYTPLKETYYEHISLGKK